MDLFTKLSDQEGELGKEIGKGRSCQMENIFFILVVEGAWKYIFTRYLPIA